MTMTAGPVAPVSRTGLVLPSRVMSRLEKSAMSEFTSTLAPYPLVRTTRRAAPQQGAGPQGYQLRAHRVLHRADTRQGACRVHHAVYCSSSRALRKKAMT